MEVALHAEFSPGPPHRLKRRYLVVTENALNVFSSHRDKAPKWSFLLSDSYRLFLTASSDGTDQQPVDIFLILSAPYPGSLLPLPTPARLSTALDIRSFDALPRGSLQLRTEGVKERSQLISSLRARLLNSAIRDRLSEVSEFARAEKELDNALTAEKSASP